MVIRPGTEIYILNFFPLDIVSQAFSFFNEWDHWWEVGNLIGVWTRRELIWMYLQVWDHLHLWPPLSSYQLYGRLTGVLLLHWEPGSAVGLGVEETPMVTHPDLCIPLLVPRAHLYPPVGFASTGAPLWPSWTTTLQPVEVLSPTIGLNLQRVGIAWEVSAPWGP